MSEIDIPDFVVKSTKSLRVGIRYLQECNSYAASIAFYASVVLMKIAKDEVQNLIKRRMQAPFKEVKS
ncbi:MAG: hypothetical protein E6Q97_14975 [Desulfurellales bacterium]|nr:MAG: hypothetical protein E6Q97_14975 [Desulfurellales bacterium]